MMGLHHTHPVLWGPERLDGLTADLGLEMFAPLPTDLIPRNEPESPWSYVDPPEEQEYCHTADLSKIPVSEVDGDPFVPVRSSSSTGRKRKEFEPTCSYSSEHEQIMANIKVEREDRVYMVADRKAHPSSVPTDLTFSSNDGSQSWSNIEALSWSSTEPLPTQLHIYSRAEDVHEDDKRLDSKPSSFLPATEFPEGYQPATPFREGHQQQEIIHLDDEDSDDDIYLVEQEMPESSEHLQLEQELPGFNEQEQVQVQSEQVQAEKSISDVNQAIQCMPQGTADAFKELFRLVGASDSEASQLAGSENPSSLNSTSVSTSFQRAESENTVSFNSTTVNADVVLYAPKPNIVSYDTKPEPLDARDRSAGSTVLVKQEYQQYPNASYVVPVDVVGESAAGPCVGRTRALVLTAMDTFERCRQHIMKDPSYGQTTQDVLKTSNSKRLRADLKAACLMRRKGFWLHETDRPIGEVPGVAVGDTFRYRIEMAVIGLHRAVQAGIAVIPVKYSPYDVTLASSVVIGVGDPYQDDNDMGERVVYSGQGGLCGKTKEWQDQELKRGNLAMSNSYIKKTPIRLIRGHKDQNSVTGILYSYDGLYEITDMKYVTGVNGKKVYMFYMVRLPGQPPIYGAAYPTPLGSQHPGLPVPDNGVGWTQAPETKTLYLDRRSAELPPQSSTWQRSD